MSIPGPTGRRALVPLENSAWGFESNCFVCEPENDAGLGIAFFHDVEAGVVVANFVLDDRFSGAPNYVHGGITLAVLDEAMAWTAIAVAGSFALTRTTTTRFLRPVAVGGSYRVEGRLEARNEDGTLDLSATVTDGEGGPCAEARAEFVPMDAERAGAAIGTVAGDDATFVAG
ncbi:MAG: PaaI family thioesterase [Acidimicrobiales bacterium]